MQRTSLGFLLTLNAVLLGAVYLTAGPVQPVQAQAVGGGARYTMVAAETDGANDESTVFLIDLQSSATIPLRFRNDRNPFAFARGRVLSEDAAAIQAQRGADAE